VTDQPTTDQPTIDQLNARGLADALAMLEGEHLAMRAECTHSGSLLHEGLHDLWSVLVWLGKQCGHSEDELRAELVRCRNRRDRADSKIASSELEPEDAELIDADPDNESDEG
jgi:hypothetical protein